VSKCFIRDLPNDTGATDLSLNLPLEVMSTDELPTQGSSGVRPYSIDLTLELERELDMDSLPPASPCAPQDFSRPQSLDPYVLASIVTQLRLDVTELTKERDELSAVLAESQACEESLKETLHYVSEKCIRLESELAAALDKNKEDADAVAMLRSKLEDSRRALMRLQTESRRMSTNLTLDLSRGGGHSLPNAPPSSKRASFTPLTGSPAGHRRISSVSEPGMLSSLNFAGQTGHPSSPSSSGFDTHFANFQSPPSTSRRSSGFFGRPSPMLYDQLNSDAAEAEELRKELQRTKEQLDEAKHELSECQEAREASETCVNALRTFIAESSIGLNRNNPPQSSSQAHADTSSNIGSSRWSFKLWKADTPANSPTPLSPPVRSPSMVSSPPPRTMLSGFFGGRGSISTLPPVTQHTPSDSSSVEDTVVEPISPLSELPKGSDGARVVEGSSIYSEPMTFSPPIKESVLHSEVYVG